MPKVKPTAPIPITTDLNISALAREHGVSRKTITRRLAKGWRPVAEPHAHIPPSPVRTLASASGPISMVKTKVVPVAPALDRVHTHLRPPLGVVRGVLLLLGVAFYVFVACAAVGR